MYTRHPVLAAMGAALLAPAVSLANQPPPHQFTSPSSLHAHVQALASHSNPSHATTPVAKSPHVRANGQSMCCANGTAPSHQSGQQGH